MTAVQLAREECSNFNSDTMCLGMNIANDGSMIALWGKPPKRCVILDNMPCRFYEECVLAGIPAISNEKKADAWQEAADEYNQRRKHECDGRNSEGSVERDGNGGSVGGDAQTTAANGPGGRRSCNSGVQGEIRLFGRGHTEMARSKEIGSRLIRRRF
ncbi:MAG: hypothetical protein WCS52_07240 [bacterium]